MSAKLGNVFSDENTGLQKQIGCMNGLFQMFDRRHLLTGRRHYRSNNQKRLPSAGQSTLQNSSSGVDCKECPPRLVLERHLSKSLNESKKLYIDLSRVSFSSSRTSLSSLDCNKSTQQVPEFLKESPRSMSSDYHTRNTCQEPSINRSKISSVQFDKHHMDSRDVRDLVKESIYRGSRGLLIKSSTKEEVANHVFKHRDSPRPMPLSTVIEGPHLPGKSRMPMDLDDTLRVLEKLKGATWNSLEPHQDSSFHSTPREAHRFSFDGQEISQTNKSSNKIKELPRLSLDSRTASDTSNMHQRSSTASSLLLELGSNKSHPGVVAKLMGLEVMPNLSIIVTSSAKKDCESFSPQRRSKQDQLSHTATSLKDSSEAQPEQYVSLPKPVSNSRVPIEAAPWRQQGRFSSPQRTRFVCREAQMKQHNESIYTEIEKKLKELEFRHSDKNLRALKQLLCTMQAKGLLETKEDEDSGQKDYTAQSLRLANVRSSQFDHQVPTWIKGSSQPPIVVMKPAKSFGRTACATPLASPPEGLPGLRKLRTNDSADRKKNLRSSRSDKDKSPKVGLEISPRTRQSLREKSGSSPKASNSLSPRLQQRKLELERKSCSSLSSPVSCNPRSSPATRQSSESVSPRHKLSLKLTQAQRSRDRLSETGSELKTSNQKRDEISLRSDSSNSLASQVDIQATFADQPAEMNITLLRSSKSSSSKTVISAATVLKHEKFLSSSDEDASPKKFGDVVTDQPSPVSVLDASFYQDDLPPSPVKKISPAFKGSETHISVACWNPESLNHSPKCNLSNEINHNKLGNIRNQAHVLRKLSSSNEITPVTDNRVLMTGMQNADEQYVLEILLASGLMLRDLSSLPVSLRPLQIHPSGHPINSDLFFVLEQTKSDCIRKPKVRLKSDPEKLRRKLLFDLVNEILAKKFEQTSLQTCSKLLNSPRKLASRIPSGKFLLKEVCLEIKELQADCKNGDNSDDEDSIVSGDEILQKLEWLEDSVRENSEVVLEIEKLIFKDLIDEVMIGEASYSFQAKRNRRCRQLFAL